MEPQQLITRSTNAASTGITRRQFALSHTMRNDRHWVRNDPFATAFFNALSVVFPKGETFMIRTLSAWKGKAPEPLNAQIEDFIFQEAAHSREHVFANHMIGKAGYDIAPLENSIQNVVDRLQNMGPVGSLCGTMCIEHLTAIIAAEVIANDHLRDVDPEHAAFWHWHAIEEIEHKAVAFDVWAHATRDWNGVRRWAMRSIFMVIIAVSFLYNRSQGQLTLLKQDGYSTGPALRGMFAYGFGKGGIGRNIVRPLFAFFRPGYHPWQIDDAHLVAKGQSLLDTRASQPQTEPAERRARPRMKKAA